jgi:hypothetical protein
MRWYILDENRVPIPVDLDTGARWFEENTDKRIVAKTSVKDNVEVSTVFLGLTHGYGNDGRPILYETMVFGGANDGDCRRYATEEKAIDGHNDMAKALLFLCGET